MEQKKKTTIEQWQQMMDEYDYELAEIRRHAGKPEKNQPEECMDDILVEHEQKNLST